MIFPARRCRVVVEIADCRLPRGVIAHGQGGVDLPALSLYFRAVSRRLRDDTQVVPLLPTQRERRCAHGDGLRELRRLIHVLPDAFLEQRQPLRAIHRREIQLNALVIRERRRGSAVRRPDGFVQRQLTVEQPAAVEMVRATRAAGQFEAVQVAHDVKRHGQRLSGLFIQRCRQLAAEIFQIASKIDLILRTGVVGQFNIHLPLPGGCTINRLLNGFRQYIHPRGLPVTVQIDSHLVGLLPLGGREVDVDGLIEPVGCERLTLQVAVHKAELSAEVLQRTFLRFDIQAVVVQAYIIQM